MDPLYLFKGKCHCLVKLPQLDRQDRKHLLMLSLILPAHFTWLLSEAIQGNLEERQLINELKELQKIGAERYVRTALGQLELDLHRFFPIELLKDCALPKLRRFAESEWPE